MRDAEAGPIPQHQAKSVVFGLGHAAKIRLQRLDVPPRLPAGGDQLWLDETFRPPARERGAGHADGLGGYARADQFAPHHAITLMDHSIQMCAGETLVADWTD